jgi:hypothetical protein
VAEQLPSKLEALVQFPVLETKKKKLCTSKEAIIE